MAIWFLFFVAQVFPGYVTASQDFKTIYMDSYTDLDGSYEQPSSSDLCTAQNLFLELLTNRTISPLSIAEWESLGFSLDKVVHDNEDFIILYESPAARGRGYGFYAVRLTPCASCNVALQAIHRGTEYYVPEVTFNMFVEQGLYTAAAWNTLQRNMTDLGKQPLSFYNAFTRAFASSLNTPVIVQLHGFNKKSHKTSADIILSSTKKQQTTDNRKHVYDEVVAKLKLGLDSFNVFHYPEDIQQLGGTLNINAKFFYDTNPGGFFFHAETSVPLRKRLDESEDARSNFTTSFSSIGQALHSKA